MLPKGDSMKKFLIIGLSLFISINVFAEEIEVAQSKDVSKGVALPANASFNFANLTLDNVERVEVLRGPHTTLYGSDAIGGVINIITKKGMGKPKVRHPAKWVLF